MTMFRDAIIATLTLAIFTVCAGAKEIPAELRAPDGRAPLTNKPVKVYILSGQSNMVGIGQVDGGGTRWSGVTDATVSVYSGAYSATADYDKLKPIQKQALPVYGGTKPTPFPGGGTQVARGNITLKTSGIYQFMPGYGGSTYNTMTLDGVEVYRREPGKDAAQKDFKIEAGKTYVFAITFFTNEATGLGWYKRTDVPGTLQTLVHVDGKFPYLKDDNGGWTERNDVWYKGLVTAAANKWLSVGCGARSNNIGPELGFGHVMGYYHDEPVILIKSSQGNRSLSWDFLPPGSERYEIDGKIYAGYKDSSASWEKGEQPKTGGWYAGKQYDDCFKPVHEILNNFGKHFPQYKDQGFEVAGFVWWQGHKDGSDAAASRYEQNLVRLIQSLRKEFDVPKAPFVIGTIGFGGWEMAGPHAKVAKAQLAVSGETGKYPDFKGNVLTVETRDFWEPAEMSPRNQDFHYNQNAGVYMNVGEALGRGMVKILDRDAGQ